MIDPSGLWWLPLYGKACVSSGGETSCEEYVVAFAWVDDGIYPPMGGGVDGEGGSVGGQDTGPGFLTGEFGFSEQERQRLAKAYERVTSKKCQEFFDDTLARMRQNGEIASRNRFTPSTLQGVLSITTLNKYSPSLTAQQVGVSQSVWANVQSTFANSRNGKYASAVILPNGRVFLGDNAFYISGPIASFFGVNSADLSGIIVHEFFHRAGLSESQVVGLHSAIQRNCGIPGFAL